MTDEQIAAEKTKIDMEINEILARMSIFTIGQYA